MRSAVPVEEKCQACDGVGHGCETTVSTPPCDISAPLHGMRRERAGHEELGSVAVSAIQPRPGAVPMKRLIYVGVVVLLSSLSAFGAAYLALSRP